jgi:elongation factor P
MADNLLATQLRKGMIVKIDNKLFRIFDRQHVTPGNLRGFVRVKMRNIQNGSMAEEKFRSKTSSNASRSSRRRCSISTTTVAAITSWTR